MRKEISGKVKPNDFNNYWKKAKKKTSSSFLGLHFGHYIFLVEHLALVDLHAMYMDLVLATGTVLTRCAKGLPVML